MATTPNFASTVKSWATSISSADTSRTAPTNTGTLVTAGSSGSRIDEITITGAGTSTTANVVRVFLYSGTTYYLYREVLISANTASASNPTFTTTLAFNSFVIPSGWSVRVTTNNAEAYHVTAFGGDF